MLYRSVCILMAYIIFRGDSLSRRQLKVHVLTYFIFQSYDFIFKSCLGPRWLNMPVIASEFFKASKFKGKS